MLEGLEGVEGVCWKSTRTGFVWKMKRSTSCNKTLYAYIITSLSVMRNYWVATFKVKVIVSACIIET